MRSKDVKTVFEDKFIAFIDIIGFKSMVEDAENGRGRSLPELQTIMAELGRQKDQSFYREHGPQICPQSARISDDLGFEITQVSDCAVASAEVSPAGVINIVNHCWAAAMMLLTHGVMIRGYITRGSIVHEGQTIIGSGYHHAYEREGQVRAFKKEADEQGTPFVEVDPVVCDYIRSHTDECVREMFGRYVARDGELTALFPFKRLAPVIGGGVSMICRTEGEHLGQIYAMRRNLATLKERVLQHADPANDHAMRKARHYIAALDRQLEVCDKLERFVRAPAAPLYPGNHP
jgi:hypothetical protein